MSIWDKLGFSNKKDPSARAKEEPQAPSSDASHAKSLVTSVGDDRLSQLLAARKKTPLSTEGTETLASRRVETYLNDYLPEAKKGEEDALNKLRTFGSEESKAAYLKQWASAQPHLKSGKTFPDWLSDKREVIIESLRNAEEYRAVIQHIHDAFQEAGKNAGEALKVLERKAAEIVEQTNDLVRRGIMDDRVGRLRMQSRQLYVAANKLDELIK